MRLFAAAVAAVHAAVVCDLSLTSRQMMMVSMENGDDRISFTSLVMQCADLWKDTDGVTQVTPVPLYGKKCRQWDQIYDAKADACGTCPDWGKDDDFAALVNDKNKFDKDRGDEFQGCYAQGGACECSVINKVTVNEGGWEWEDWRWNQLRVAPKGTCSETSCFRFEPFSRIIGIYDNSLIMPALDCGDLEIKTSTIEGVPNMIVPPAIKKDPLHAMFRLMNNFGFETEYEIFTDPEVKFVENKAVILAVNAFESRGSTQKIGPNLEEMQAKCSIKLNVFLDSQGKALKDNAFIPVADIPVVPPPCVADDMTKAYEGYKADLEGIDKVRTMDVECTNEELPGMGGPGGGPDDCMDPTMCGYDPYMYPRKLQAKRRALMQRRLTSTERESLIKQRQLESAQTPAERAFVTSKYAQLFRKRQVNHFGEQPPTVRRLAEGFSRAIRGFSAARRLSKRAPRQLSPKLRALRKLQMRHDPYSYSPGAPRRAQTAGAGVDAYVDAGGAYDPYGGTGGAYDPYGGTGGAYDPYGGTGGAYDPYNGAYDPYAGDGGAYDPYAGDGGAYDPYSGGYDPYSGDGGAYDPYSGGYDPYNGDGGAYDPYGGYDPYHYDPYNGGYDPYNGGGYDPYSGGDPYGGGGCGPDGCPGDDGQGGGAGPETCAEAPAFLKQMCPAVITACEGDAKCKGVLDFIASTTVDMDACGQVFAKQVKDCAYGDGKDTTECAATSDLWHKCVGNMGGGSGDCQFCQMEAGGDMAAQLKCEYGVCGRKDEEAKQWEVKEGMRCDEKRHILERVVESSVGRAMSFSTRDVYNGCNTLLRNWITYGTETLTETSRDCNEEQWTQTGEWNPKWQEDPCCNWELRSTKCCATRETTFTRTIVKELNQDQIGLYSAITKTDDLALRIASQFEQMEKDAAQVCWPVLEEFLKGTDDLWVTGDICWREVNGKWNDKFEAELGQVCTGARDEDCKFKTCKADADCYSGKCYKPRARSNGDTAAGGGGGDAGGDDNDDSMYCKVPMDVDGDIAGPILKCFFDKVPSSVVDYFKFKKLGLAATAPVSEVAVELLEQPGIKRTECWGNWTEAAQKSKELCEAKQDCTWQWGLGEAECLDPCGRNPENPQCGSFCTERDSRWGWELSQWATCRATGFKDYWNKEWECQEAAQKACDDCYSNLGDCWLDNTCDKCESICDWDEIDKQKRACMDSECEKIVAGSLFKPDWNNWEAGPCVISALSYDATKKDECNSECMGDAGPQPQGVSECWGKVNGKVGSWDTCWNQNGWLEQYTSQETYNNWDWRYGQPPAEYCLVKAFEVDTTTLKPYIPPPPYGFSCPAQCEQEINDCRWGSSCWEISWECTNAFNELIPGDAQQRTYSELFNECTMKPCTGEACLSLQADCIAEVGLLDAKFGEMGCDRCDDWQWSNPDWTAIRCMREVSEPTCQWGEYTDAQGAWLSQPCADSCHWDVCRFTFQSCVAAGGTPSECQTTTENLNQCRECPAFATCDEMCSTTNCRDFWWSGATADFCSGCDNTKACNYEEPCYNNPICWDEIPQFGYGCSKECSNKLETCKNNWYTTCGEIEMDCSDMWYETEMTTRAGDCVAAKQAAHMEACAGSGEACPFFDYNGAMTVCVDETATALDTEAGAGAEVSFSAYFGASGSCMICNGEWNNWGGWENKFPTCAAMTADDACAACFSSCSADPTEGCRAVTEADKPAVTDGVQPRRLSGPTEQGESRAQQIREAQVVPQYKALNKMRIEAQKKVGALSDALQVARDDDARATVQRDLELARSKEEKLGAKMRQLRTKHERALQSYNNVEWRNVEGADAEVMCTNFFDRPDVAGFSELFPTSGWSVPAFRNSDEACTKLEGQCWISMADVEAKITAAGQTPDANSATTKCQQLGDIISMTPDANGEMHWVWLEYDGSIKGGAGGCKYWPESSWDWSTGIETPGTCHEDLTLFNPARRFFPGKRDTKELCEAEVCYPARYIETQEDCDATQYCEGDCAYCTASSWNNPEGIQNTHRGCAAVDSSKAAGTANGLSEALCKKLAEGHNDTLTLHWAQNPANNRTYCMATALDGSNCESQKNIDVAYEDKDGNAATLTVSFALVNCADFQLSACDWVTKQAGFSKMTCGVQRLVCKNKADCVAAGRCEYPNEWLAEQDGGVCVTPINMTEAATSWGGYDFWSYCENLKRKYKNLKIATEYREYGCAIFNGDPNAGGFGYGVVGYRQLTPRSLKDLISTLADRDTDKEILGDGPCKDGSCDPPAPCEDCGAEPRCDAQSCDCAVGDAACERKLSSTLTSMKKSAPACRARMLGWAAANRDAFDDVALCVESGLKGPGCEAKCGMFEALAEMSECPCTACAIKATLQNERAAKIFAGCNEVTLRTLSEAAKRCTAREFAACNLPQKLEAHRRLQAAEYYDPAMGTGAPKYDPYDPYMGGDGGDSGAGGDDSFDPNSAWPQAGMKKETCEKVPGAVWFKFGFTKSECERPGHFLAQSGVKGSFMCCVESFDYGYGEWCAQFSQDNKQDCEKCEGAKWMSIFQFRRSATWVQAKWTSPYEWKQRTMQPRNRYIQTVDQWTLAGLFESSITQMRSGPLRTFVYCRSEPILTSLRSIAEGKALKPSLGWVDLLPKAVANVKLGKNVVQTTENTAVQGEVKIDVSVEPSSTLAGSADDSTTTTPVARRLRDTQAALVRRLNSINTLPASCYTVVRNGAGAICGQLVGDCVSFEPAANLDGSAKLCVGRQSKIPRNPKFNTWGLAKMNADGQPIVAAAGANLTDSSGSICGNVKEQGIYCPVARIPSIGSVTETFDTSCQEIKDAAAAIAAKVQELIANGGDLTLAGFYTAGSSGPEETEFGKGGAAFGADGGKIDDFDTFAEEVEDTGSFVDGNGGGSVATTVPTVVTTAAATTQEQRNGGTAAGNTVHLGVAGLLSVALARLLM